MSDEKKIEDKCNCKKPDIHDFSSLGFKLSLKNDVCDLPFRKEVLDYFNNFKKDIKDYKFSDFFEKPFNIEFKTNHFSSEITISFVNSEQKNPEELRKFRNKLATFFNLV